MHLHFEFAPRRLIPIGALALIVLGLGHAPAAPPAAESNAVQSTGVLRFTNESGRTTRFSIDDLRAMPQTKATVKDHSGESATYEGVLLWQLLERAGVPLGKSLRGPRLASYLLVEAADGYRVVFALPELDPAATDQQVLLVGRKNGQPLPAKEAPLRILVPHEKLHARWIRQIVSMRIVSAPPAEEKKENHKGAEAQRKTP